MNFCMDCEINNVFSGADSILSEGIGNFKEFLSESPFGDILGDMFDPLFSGNFDIF